MITRLSLPGALGKDRPFLDRPELCVSVHLLSTDVDPVISWVPMSQIRMWRIQAPLFFLTFTVRNTGESKKSTNASQCASAAQTLLAYWRALPSRVEFCPKTRPARRGGPEPLLLYHHLKLADPLSAEWTGYVTAWCLFLCFQTFEGSVIFAPSESLLSIRFRILMSFPSTLRHVARCAQNPA
jgi:hypothetical protein